MFVCDYNWDGIIIILGCIYCLLIAYRILPRNPKDPERQELLHRKFGKIMKILAPTTIAVGILELIGVI